MSSSTPAPSIARGRLVLFAAGDFAFNLYWQSAMVFLLFYYTEAVALPVETAALIYFVASIWDGLVNLAAGMLVDGRRAQRGFRRYLVIGAVPLGVSFVLAYLPPPAGAWWAAGAVFAGHLLFRSAYALVNVPYLAMSARISLDSGDRRLMAALRMGFGTAALVVVTLGTTQIGGWLGGEGARVYLLAAAVFAAVATVLLLFLGVRIREVALPASPTPTLRACLESLLANRAFVTLNAAAMAMIVAATVLAKSVLYYFKYALGDEAAGQGALAAMGIAGALAVPLWVIVSRRLGNRQTWFAGAGLAMLLLVGFGVAQLGTTGAMRGFLMAFQVALTGLNIVFWSMLPNTIEYGERSTGLRVEGTVFGLASLLQRVAIGVAILLLGTAFDTAGYVANVAQPPAVIAGMRWTIVGLPLAFLMLSVVLMALNPLRRHAHSAIVQELARGRAGASDPTV